MARFCNKIPAPGSPPSCVLPAKVLLEVDIEDDDEDDEDDEEIEESLFIFFLLETRLPTRWWALRFGVDLLVYRLFASAYVSTFRVVRPEWQILQ